MVPAKGWYIYVRSTLILLRPVLSFFPNLNEAVYCIYFYNDLIISGNRSRKTKTNYALIIYLGLYPISNCFGIPTLNLRITSQID